MAKVLVIVHLGRHFRIFGQSDYKVLLDMGHEVHVAANFNGEIDEFNHPNIIKHQIDFDRNPFSKQNLKALKQLKGLLKDEKFNLIHCQSPAGGAITRFAAKETRKKGTKILYTAHGLHFFQGAPKKNWILYYNFEKILGYYTDCIITINDEDYKLAKEKLKIKNVEFVHGVGIDLDKFKFQTLERKLQLRKEYGYKDNEFILICVGELNHGKNQEMAIEAISKLKYKIPNIKLLLAGSGDLKQSYEEKVNKLGIQKHVEFLGYRTDIPNLMTLSDMAISASRREGLPVNIMEAMAVGLPLVVTNCRGNRDLVNDNKNGYIVNLDDIEAFADSIENLGKNEELRRIFSQNSKMLINTYSIENIRMEMQGIYSKYIK